MRPHPYLRAYMAGIVVPTLFLLVIVLLVFWARTAHGQEPLPDPGPYSDRSAVVLDVQGPIFDEPVAVTIRARPDGEPFARGVNSITLWWDGSRWWIMGWMFDSTASNSPRI